MISTKLTRLLSFSFDVVTKKKNQILTLNLNMQQIWCREYLRNLFLAFIVGRMKAAIYFQTKLQLPNCHAGVTIIDLRVLLGTETSPEGVWGTPSTGSWTFTPGAPRIPQGVPVLLWSCRPRALQQHMLRHIQATVQQHQDMLPKKKPLRRLRL